MRQTCLGSREPMMLPDQTDARPDGGVECLQRPSTAGRSVPCPGVAAAQAHPGRFRRAPTVVLRVEKRKSRTRPRLERLLVRGVAADCLLVRSAHPSLARRGSVAGRMRAVERERTAVEAGEKEQ